MIPEFWRHFQVRSIKLEERSQKRKEGKQGVKRAKRGEENVKIFQLLIFLIKNKALLGIHLHYLKRG
ncbi:hypothetical protein DLP50_18935 [Salmonella enterica]|nr:hypothetical protein [Salmonella enterica]EBZ9404713.1 hypothetical protein [Salmonella enterica subsp. enterica serovar 4,5,12:b:-]EAM8895998.1 hypothetical protein [Salmonella enterica]EAO3941812.1 hypothetical protein [Salmonella enterica]EAS3578922.1 hypothetical protein [Salmonella enterica]